MTSGIPYPKERLAFLTATVPAPLGTAAWTSEVIAYQVRARGVEVNYQHVSHMRAGRRDNPSVVLLAAVAEVFGVPVDYFFDAARADRIEKQLASLSRMRDAGVQCLAVRGALGDVADSENGLRAARAAELTTVVTVSGYTAHEDFTSAAPVVTSLGDAHEPGNVLADPFDVRPDGTVRLPHLERLLAAAQR